MKENEFKPLPFIRELLLGKDELREYYAKKRRFLYENCKHITGLRWRNKFHPIMLELIRLNRKYIDKQTITILNDERKETSKPVIYVITHIGKFDFQIISEAIKEHQYPFAGDPETIYRSFDGLFFHLNGLVYCDTDIKTDRYIAKETAKDILRNNENLLIYPEGIWNLTPNLLSLPLFPGVIDIAIDTDSEIIPVAIEQYDSEFVVNFGQNISLKKQNEFESIDEKNKYIEEQRENLRQVLATLKYDIMSSRPIVKRSDLGTYEEEEQKFIDSKLNEWCDPKTKLPYYNREIVKNRMYHQYEDPKEVFEFFKNISLSKNNAFLFKQDSSLPLEIEKFKQKEIERIGKKR